MKLNNRVVILTGATQGIGRATAGILAQDGCKLVLAARSDACLQALTDTLTASSHEAIAIPTDMGNTIQAAALAQKTVEAFGQIDIVINNAAIIVSMLLPGLMDKFLWGMPVLIPDARFLKNRWWGGLVGFEQKPPRQGGVDILDDLLA